MNDLSLYIHIPYCKRKCTYCNFHFSTNFSNRKELLKALSTEIKTRASEIEYSCVDTIYLGGGTPSILTEDELEELFTTIYKYYRVAHQPEITIEINPDDFDGNKAMHFQSVGINRLSIGIQSFFDNHLLWMNRSHNSDQSHNCIRIAKNQGFSNISCDLIFGIPDCPHLQWEENVHQLIGYDIPHLSCYALTIEERTQLFHNIKYKKDNPPEDNHTIEQMDLLFNIMDQHQYEAYEISSYSKKGFRSLHNSKYWSHLPYLGFGPSSHSFNGTSRRWNVSNNSLYIKLIDQNEVYFEQEKLSETDLRNEYIMLNLRKAEGIQASIVFDQISDPYKLEQLIQNYILSGHLIITENRIQLTNKGKFISDRIISDLFI